VATGLLIFALGLFELFIGPLNLPEWLAISHLHQLKSRLASILVLVLAVTFLEHYVEGAAPVALLESAVAATLVGGLLIAFSYFGKKEP